MVIWAFFYATCIILGAFGACLASRLGRTLGLIDRPGERSSHSVPMPKGGGIGILVTLVVGAILFSLPMTLWIPACIVSMISLLGDYREISFKIRLAVQVASAAVFGSTLFFKRPMPDISVGIIVSLFVFSVLFIVATANYFNFMDGINGIAGLTGLIAFSCLGVFALLEGKDHNWAAAAFGIAAACLGFLPLNFPRARVFMGDVGSTLLGFLFAAWVLWFSQSLGEFLVLSSFIFPFYVDEISTLIVRTKQGATLTSAHRRHIYQILANQAGIPHSTVTGIYGLIQIVVATAAWLAMKESLSLLILVLLCLAGLLLSGGIRVRRRWETSVRSNDHGHSSS